MLSPGKVGPMRSDLIPRLEFLGNLLAARLVDSIKAALEKEVKFDEIFYWTDSLIRSFEKELGIFVEYRR